MEAARPATAPDVPVLAALARDALGELRTRKGGALHARREARKEPIEDSLAADVADPDALVLVGTIDGMAVGYVVVRVETLTDGATLGRVTDLYVDPGARAVGVGEALVEPVLGWCRERRCVGVDAVAMPGDRNTKNFFETFGFTARALVVHRPLDEG